LRPSPGIINVLQAGRAIAALSVVAYHAVAFTETFIGKLPVPLTTVVSRGYLGVDFFFVLSGFIIFHTNRGKTDQEGWGWRYATTRIVRLYIPYLPIGLVVALGYTLLPTLSAAGRDWSWFATVTLVPSDRDTALLVAWTLRHELVFYTIFFLAFWTRYAGALFGVWTVAMIVAALVWPDMPPAAVYVLGIIDIEFLLGICVALLIATRVPSWLFLTAAAVVFAVYLALGAQVGQRLTFAIALASLLVALVRWEVSGKLTPMPVLVFLGNASYAIYLVHNPLMALVVRMMRVAPTIVAAATLFVAGASAGVLYHLIWEKPALAAARRRLKDFPWRKHEICAT
jgi:exopolysaccharide production protein ExoZ